MDVVLFRQRVAPGKEERLREWMAEIRGREDEARATHEDEGVYTETAFLEDAEDGTYLVYYIETVDADTMREAFADSDHEIDAEHKRVMDEVLADGTPVSDVEVLYHMTRERP